MNDFDSICDPTTGGAAAGAWDAVAALGGGKAVAPSAPQRIDPETMDALLRGVSGITHPGHPPVQDDAGGTAQFRGVPLINCQGWTGHPPVRAELHAALKAQRKDLSAYLTAAEALHSPFQDLQYEAAQFRTDVRALNFNLTEASDKYDAALAAAAALRGDPPMFREDVAEIRERLLFGDDIEREELLCETVQLRAGIRALTVDLIAVCDRYDAAMAETLRYRGWLRHMTATDPQSAAAAAALRGDPPPVT
jgi:hypothetical protein